MKKISLLIILIILATATYMWWPSGDALGPSGKDVSLEDYVTENISKLSPIKEQVGGTFYVTYMNVSEGKGFVTYEDGHNSYTADFTFSTSERSGHKITSFKIR